MQDVKCSDLKTENEEFVAAVTRGCSITIARVIYGGNAEMRKMVLRRLIIHNVGDVDV